VVNPPIARVKPVALEESPAAATPVTDATLRLELDTDARTIIDGRAATPSSDGKFHLRPGKHRVVVSGNALASPRVFALDLRAGDSVTRAVRRGHGRLSVAVAPWAEVSLDGRKLGVTPFSPVEVPEGTHTVQFKNDDLHALVRRQITVQPGRETFLKVDLFNKR